MKRLLFPLLVLFALSVALGATTMTAAAAEPIVGCQNNFTGQLRIIQDWQNCTANETRIEFQSHAAGDATDARVDAVVALIGDVIACFQNNTFTIFGVTLFNPAGVIGCLSGLAFP